MRTSSWVTHRRVTDAARWSPRRYLTRLGAATRRLPQLQLRLMFNVGDLLPPVRPWLQGSRSLAPDEVTSMKWQELLFCRLTGQFSRYITSPTTLQSEGILELDRSIYYGIGRNSPEFGETVAMFQPLETFGSHSAVTTPFDTGGLAQGHIMLRPGSPPAADVVQRSNVSIDQHQRRLNDWIDAAYPPGDYRADEASSRPADSPVAAIQLTAATDDRGWTWEGRIIATDYTELPLTVRKVYLKRGALQRYWDWLEDFPPLGPAALPPHEAFVKAVSEEVDSPYESMMTDLGGSCDA